MAQNMEPRPVIPKHFVPPTARELRGQSVHRLQVGLFGLAAMLLLVALANIINDSLRQEQDAGAANVAAAPAQDQAGDPLAGIGRAPEAGTGPSESAGKRGN